MHTVSDDDTANTGNWPVVLGAVVVFEGRVLWWGWLGFFVGKGVFRDWDWWLWSGGDGGGKICGWRHLFWRGLFSV